jgi:RNA polymerase sigma-70 factor (ECF subfamily)
VLAALVREKSCQALLLAQYRAKRKGVVAMKREVVESFEAQIKPHISRLRASLARRFPKESIDDILQETWLVAWQKREKLQDIQCLDAWLTVVARRKALDLSRRERRFKSEALKETLSLPCAEASALITLPQSAEALLSQQQSRSLIAQAFAALPSRQHTVLTRRVLHEESPKEIAYDLDIAEKTVYATEASAREKLQHSSMMRHAWEILCASAAYLFLALPRFALRKANAALSSTKSLLPSLATFQGTAYTSFFTTAALSAFVLLSVPRSSLLQTSPKTERMAFSSSLPTPQPSHLTAEPTAHQDALTPTAPKARPTQNRETSSQKREKRQKSAKSNRKRTSKQESKEPTMKLSTALIAASLLLTPVLSAQAQQKAPASAQVTNLYPKITKIDFDTFQISANLHQPDGLWLDARKKMRLKSLISLRSDFRKGIQKNISQL